MIQIAADEQTGYLINADREAMLVIRDLINLALDEGSCETVCLGQVGVVPFRVMVSDTPEDV